MAHPSAAEAQTPFFAISIHKLLVLSFCTLGLYPIYWFYRNWQLVKEREQINVLPFARAFFAFFFCYQMFKKIRDFNIPNANRSNLQAGLLAVAWIVAALISHFFGGFYLLISLSAPIIFVPVQIRVNQINDAVAPDHDKNNRFSALNWLTIVLGGPLLLLAVLGSFLPTK